MEGTIGFSTKAAVHGEIQTNAKLHPTLYTLEGGRGGLR